MPTAGVPLWSTTAASNASVDPAVNWNEGQAPSTVNNSARGLMASVAKWRNDLYGITTGGSGTAYTVATGSTFASAADMSGVVFCIVPHATSGAAPTLAVDGLTARAINVATTVAVPTGALVEGTPYLVKYVHATTEFIILGTLAKYLLSALDIINGVSSDTIATDDTIILYDLSETANRRMLVSDFLKVVNVLTEDTTPDSAADFVLTYDGSDTAAKKVKLSNIPSSLPRRYRSGGILSNGTDATNDINISAGAWRDITDAVDIIIPAIAGKQLDANWVAGPNAGMRNSAAGIANATYHIYAVRTAASPQADIYAHTSASEATALAALQSETGGADYIYARRIGSIVRVSNAIRIFKQRGNYIAWVVPVQSADNLDVDPAVAVTLAVPVGIEVEAEVSGWAHSSTNNAVMFLYPSDMTPTATASSGPADAGATTNTGSISASAISPRFVWTNINAEITAVSTANNGLIDLYTLGYRDPLGELLMAFGRLGSLGRGFGKLGGSAGISVVDPLAPNAPVITWASAPGVDPPTIDSVIDNTVSEGDTYERQIAENALFTGATTISTSVSASDIGSLEVVWGDDEAAMDAFGAGTWYVRDRVGPPGHLSAWSNTIFETITEAFVEVALEGGFLYPGKAAHKDAASMSTAGTMDAATEKVALIGRIYWDGRPSGAKTISAAGGGSIVFPAGAVTFANGGSTIEIGLQDVSAITPTPDGTFDVSRVLTGNAVPPIAANAANTVAMTGGSGSKALVHGDLVAVVFDMTARAGADSVVINGVGILGLTLNGIPGVNTYLSGAWGAGYVGPVPSVVIVADDGTIGYLDNAAFVSTVTTENYGDGTNPDERGIIFQTTFDCSIDGFYLHIRPDGDWTLKLYEDPTGTPSALATITQTAEVFGSPGNRIGFYTLPSPIKLTKNADYCLAVKATEANNLRLTAATMFAEGHRVLNLGGATVKKATRDGGSGAFTPESPAVTTYTCFGVRVSHIHTPA